MYTFGFRANTIFSEQSIDWCNVHSTKSEAIDLSKNGGLDVNTLSSFASNHSDQRSSISSSCRSSKCCCSSYDCSYCSPQGSLNDESHTVDEGEDDGQQDDLTLRDEQKSLLTESSDAFQGDINPQKMTYIDDKQNENTYIVNNVDATASPTCKLHHHHHHHHAISSMRPNAIALRLPLNSSKDLGKKSWDCNNLCTKPMQFPSVVSGERKNHFAIEHIRDTNPLGTKEDSTAQGSQYYHNYFSFDYLIASYLIFRRKCIEIFIQSIFLFFLKI